MEFRKLGRTDLQVSAFGLGCGNFGGIGSAPEFFRQGRARTRPSDCSTGLSRRHILNQIDASLDRLGVDHLDMYIVHDRDPDTPLDETLDALDTAPTATKFESGTPPVPSIYAGVAGMDLMDEIGIAATEAHVQGLTDLLIEGLDEVDANIVTPLDPSKRGPMIAVASTDEHAMVQALADDGIVTSSRDGNVRLSWHCYNSTEDVDAVVAGMRRHAEFLAR